MEILCKPEIFVIDFNNVFEKNIIQRTDIILTIIELAIYPNKYKLEGSNKTIRFWKKAKYIEAIKDIIMFYRADTLRKFWYIIRKCKDIQKYIEVLQNYSYIINNMKYHLLTIIKMISKFIIGHNINFESFITKINKNVNLSRNSIKKEIEDNASLSSFDDLSLQQNKKHIAKIRDKLLSTEIYKVYYTDI